VLRECVAFFKQKGQAANKGYDEFIFIINRIKDPMMKGNSQLIFYIYGQKDMKNKGVFNYE
jgi:hypothetical protein